MARGQRDGDGAQGQQRTATGDARTRTRAWNLRSRGRAAVSVAHLVLAAAVASAGPLGCNKSEPASASRADSAASTTEAVPTATAVATAAPPISPTEAKADDKREGDAPGGVVVVPMAPMPMKTTLAPPRSEPERKSPTETSTGAKGGSGRARGPAKLKDADLSPPPPPSVFATQVPGGAFDGLGVGAGGRPIDQSGGKIPLGTTGKGSAFGAVGDAAAQAPIDPNGRFATTYRPGAGHLAAFDSAVARGIVPADEREVVSDLGARYSPDFALPKGKTLFAQNALERAKQPPAGGPVHLRIALKSADIAPAARPHLSVHLVLDVSGSMAGASIENARTAAAALVDKLAPGDDFSLVTFSSDAQVLVPDGPVGTRRAAIKQTIAGIHEGGGTNIGMGLKLGYQEASKSTIPADAVKVVLLLSDGRANSGILDQGRLSTLALNAFQDGVQTSTFGLGGDYDGALMSSIANDGAGGYYYLRDAQQIAPALATEMDKRLDPVATALEVRVRLRPGVQLLQAYGSRRLNASEEIRVRVQEIAADVQAERKGIKRDRQDDQKGGMRFFMPGFARNDAHAILLKLSLPEGVGDKEVALVELKYKDRVKKANVQEELVVKTSYAGSDAESASTIDGSVARSVQGFAAGETLAEAAQLISNGSRDSAVALLSEREGILRQMADTMSEPLFLKDADRLARLRSHAGSTTGLGDPLVLAMLLETASNAHRR